MGQYRRMMIKMVDGELLLDSLHVDGGRVVLGVFDPKKAGKVETVERHGQRKQFFREIKGNTIAEYQRGCFFVSCGNWRQTFKVQYVSQERIHFWSWNYPCQLKRVK
jgi:hypothetical protein